MENLHASVADAIFVAEPGGRIIDVDSATRARYWAIAAGSAGINRNY
jgi:hypothetical protein